MRRFWPRAPATDPVRPFSRSTYFLRGLWDGVPVLFWLAAGGWTYFQVIALGMLPYLGVLAGIFLVVAVMRLLRPVRKFLLIQAYSLMVRSPMTPLIELGTWKLLLACERLWPGAYCDYIGTVVFARVYQRLSQERRWRRLRILWQVDLAARPHLAKAARSFMRAVDAPLQPPGVVESGGND